MTAPFQGAKGPAAQGPDVRPTPTISYYTVGQDPFYSENAAHIPATEAATAQKSRRRYNANVVGGFDFSPPLQRNCSVWQPRRRRSSSRCSLAAPRAYSRLFISHETTPDLVRSLISVWAAMEETDIMDLTHQKAKKRPRPVSSVDESVHASLKRLPMRAAECREPALMFAVRGEPLPAASLKQNDHSVNSSPTAVMPAQVRSAKNFQRNKHYPPASFNPNAHSLLQLLFYC